MGTILGSYDSVDDLEAEHPTGSPGDFYYINPDLYVWDESSGSWMDVGQIAGPQGIQGIQGERGDVGPPGQDGQDGRDGQDGQDGAAATVQVGTVTELPYGSTPTVTNVGTTTNAIFDFGIPAPPPPTIQVYRRNLSTAGSSLVIPLGGLNYDLRYLSASSLQLYFRPTNTAVPVVADYRIVSQYNETSILTTYFNAMQGDSVSFNSTSNPVDTDIYNTTQETHQTWLRVRNPANNAQWSTYEVKMLSSANAARVIVWVMVIDENGTY